ncbi:MAG: hypothetical protein P8O16_18595 [Algoriphagus sp.]|uniref:hypothetical protein n=1 Tax=Algoriphagus sp. TaxID=1872435 RepID=UPI00260814A9|nr:hypothetical protein [Algoriphagus sp.]MDG1279295.1 hypothetical protein [Algoriphagus sp.]
MTEKIVILAIICGFINHGFAQTGCYFGNSSLPQQNLTKYSGNSDFDEINNREYNTLVNVFDIHPDIYYLLDEESPNAYATSTITNTNFPDGTIMLGFSLIQLECLNSSSGTCSSIPIILAHEFAHIIDFKYMTGLTGKYKELFADYMAGSYLFHRANTLGTLNVAEVGNSFFSKGDYDFNSPQHHGTREQRLSSLIAGYKLAYYYSTKGQLLNLNTLMENAIQYVGQF